MSVSITRDNELRQEVWMFEAIDGGRRFGRILLTEYVAQSRPTKRHKFTAERRYQARNRRDSNIPAMPTPPQDVIDQALAEFRAMITYDGVL